MIKFKILITVFVLLLISSTVVFASPVIFYTDILSGPNSGTNDGPGGCYLTIFGKGFGATQGISSVTIGGGAVGAYKSWSDTKVSVQLGTSSTSGGIVLTVASESATAPDQFTVRSGDIYFVSLTGSDTNGIVNDINHPFRTPNYVVRDLSAFDAGDFVVVRGGTYDLDDGNNNLVARSWLRANKSGSAGSPLTFIGYPGETAIAQKDDDSMLFGHYGDISHWVVADFSCHLTSCDPQGENVDVVSLGSSATTCPAGYDAHYTRMVNFDIYGGCAHYLSSHIEIGRSEHTKLLGVSIHDSGDGGEAHSHPIYLAAEQQDTEVGWCHLYNIQRSRALIQIHVDSFGDTCWGNKSITDIYVHDCRIHDVNGEPILVDGGTGDIYIYNNTIYNAPMAIVSPSYEDIMSLRGSGGEANIRVYNNTIYTNTWASNAGYILGIGSVSTPYHTDFVFYNNIFYTTDPNDKYYEYQSGDSSYYTITADNNAWYGSSGSEPTWSGANKVTTQPTFADVANNDFHLTNSSNCKNAGTTIALVAKDYDGVSRPQGSAYDIGAYEYIEAVAYADFYIDQSATDDSGAGTKADPWKHCPGMVGWSGSHTVVPGDTFIFKGGETWGSAELPLTVAVSGTSGSPVTYTVDKTWYTGGSYSNPVFEGSTTITGWTVYSGNVYSVSLSNTFDSLFITAANGDVTWGLRQSSLSAVTSEYQFYHDIGANTLYLYAPSDPNTLYSSTKIGIRDGITDASGTGESYIVIDGIEVRFCGKHDFFQARGITISDGENYWTIKNSDVHHIGHREATEGGDGIFLNSGIGHLVQNNKAYECGRHGIYVFSNGSLSNCVVAGNEVWNNYHANIDINQNNNTSNSGHVIKHNYIYQTPSFVDLDGIGATGIHAKGYDSDTLLTNVYIFGNVIADLDHYHILMNGWENDIHIYNNTIVNTAGGGDLIYVTATGQPHVEIKNNVLFASTAGVNDGRCYVISNTPANNDVDYNLCFRSASTRLAYVSGTNYTDWEVFKSATGYDTHGMNADPLINDLNAKQYFLQTDSPANGAGISLNDNYDDILDPSTTWPDNIIVADQESHGAPDIGAYWLDIVHLTIQLGSGTKSIQFGSGTKTITFYHN